MRLLFVCFLLVCVGCDGFFAELDEELEPDSGPIIDTDAGDSGVATDASDAAVATDADLDMTDRDMTGLDMTNRDATSGVDADTNNDATNADVSDCDASTEICDGIDNDCDGETDEDFPNLGSPCDSDDDTDTCPDGVVLCDGFFETVCLDDPQNATRTEICRGDFPGSCIDPQDSNLADLSIIGSPCDSDDSDFCANGLWTCSGMQFPVCRNESIVDIAELCDNLDNDCDGDTDEGFEIGESCVDGQGNCNGAWACTNSGLRECVGATNSAEICDGIDNDCDGQTDEMLNPPTDLNEPNDQPIGATSVVGMPLSSPQSPPAVTTLASGDVDFFVYTQQLMAPQSSLHFLCRVTDLAPGQSVEMTISETNPNGPGAMVGPVVLTDSDFAAVSFLPASATAGDFEWDVRLEPVSGFDFCDIDYKLTCKARISPGPSSW